MDILKEKIKSKKVGYISNCLEEHTFLTDVFNHQFQINNLIILADSINFIIKSI